MFIWRPHKESLTVVLYFPVCNNFIFEQVLHSNLSIPCFGAEFPERSAEKPPLFLSGHYYYCQPHSLNSTERDIAAARPKLVVQHSSLYWMYQKCIISEHPAEDEYWICILTPLLLSFGGRAIHHVRNHSLSLVKRLLPVLDCQTGLVEYRDPSSWHDEWQCRYASDFVPNNRKYVTLLAKLSIAGLFWFLACFRSDCAVLHDGRKAGVTFIHSSMNSVSTA